MMSTTEPIVISYNTSSVYRVDKYLFKGTYS